MSEPFSFYPYVGEEIRMVRLRLRVSQRELGARIGVSHAAISYIERGKTKPDLDYLYRIADALMVPVEQFLNPVLLAHRNGLDRHYREANQAKRRAEEALQQVPF